MTRHQAIAEAKVALAHLDRPDAEALALLLACEGLSRTDWMMRPEAPMQFVERWQRMLGRRSAGESLAVISGQAGFFDLTLSVGPGVLVPRPDTETFEQVVFGDGPVLDLGTGSGALAAWAAGHQSNPVLAVERSLMALSYARRNLPLSVTLIRGDWAQAIAPSSMGTVLSNPPYIDADEPELTGDGVVHEPRSALVADAGGLSDLRTIADQARRILKPNGWLWMEHGYQQASDVQADLIERGFVEVQSLSDLNGHPRITGGQWRG